jgi:hypothetical protein
MSTEADLIESLFSRLEGTDSHGQPLTYGGSEVAIRTGLLDTDDPSPAVVLDRPRTRGTKFLDGAKREEVRQQVRVHTSTTEAKGDYLKAYDIAREVQDLMDAAPITVGGKTVHVQQADRQPLPEQDRGSDTAMDVAMEFTFWV